MHTNICNRWIEYRKRQVNCLVGYIDTHYHIPTEANVHHVGALVSEILSLSNYLCDLPIK